MAGVYDRTILKWLFTTNENDQRAILAAKYLHQNKNIYNMIYDCVVKSFPDLQMGVKHKLYESIVKQKNLNVDILVNTEEGKMILQDHYDFVHDVNVHVIKMNAINPTGVGAPVVSHNDESKKWYNKMKEIAANFMTISPDIRVWFNRLVFGTAGDIDIFYSKRAAISAWTELSPLYFRYNNLNTALNGLGTADRQSAARIINFYSFYNSFVINGKAEEDYIKAIFHAQDGATLEAGGGLAVPNTLDVAHFDASRLTILTNICANDLILKNLITTRTPRNFTDKTKFMCHNLFSLVEKSLTQLNGFKIGSNGWNFVDQNGKEHKFERAIDFKEYLNESKCMNIGLFIDSTNKNCKIAEFNNFIKVILNEGTKDQKREALYDYLDNRIKTDNNYEFLTHDEENIKLLHPVIAREILIAFGFDIDESTGKYETVNEWINKLKRVFNLQSGGVIFPDLDRYDPDALLDNNDNADGSGNYSKTVRDVGLIKRQVDVMTPMMKDLLDWVNKRETNRTTRHKSLIGVSNRLKFLTRNINQLFLSMDALQSNDKTHIVIKIGNRGGTRSAAFNTIPGTNENERFVTLLNTGPLINKRQNIDAVNRPGFGNYYLGHDDNMQFLEFYNWWGTIKNEINSLADALLNQNAPSYIFEGGAVDNMQDGGLRTTNINIFKALTDKSNAHIHRFLNRVWDIAHYRSVAQNGKYYCNKKWDMDTNHIIPVKEYNPSHASMSGGRLQLLGLYMKSNQSNNMENMSNYSYNFIDYNAQSGGCHKKQFNANAWKNFFRRAYQLIETNSNKIVGDKFKEGVEARINEVEKLYSEIFDLQYSLRKILNDQAKNNALAIISNKNILGNNFDESIVDRLNDVLIEARKKLINAQQRANYYENSLLSCAEKIHPFILS